MTNTEIKELTEQKSELTQQNTITLVKKIVLIEPNKIHVNTSYGQCIVNGFNLMITNSNFSESTLTYEGIVTQITYIYNDLKVVE
jgi:hypothetical protein